MLETQFFSLLILFLYMPRNESHNLDMGSRGTIMEEREKNEVEGKRRCIVKTYQVQRMIAASRSKLYSSCFVHIHQLLIHLVEEVLSPTS